MKLSQKLLALSGVAVADYACCAYDDYGIPSNCGLTEKTPFAGDDWRGNACKAWEGNPDASFDGNDNACTDSENWSSCGFQRHFPWIGSGDVGYTNGALGTQDIVFGSATFSMGAGADKYTIGGAPFLGGVCKLWMPVEIADVLSVNVAGVHLSGSGTHRGDATYAGKDGSVHCFSVVNPAEFLSNDNNVHNGNVAGWRTDGTEEDEGGDGMQSDVFDGMTETLRQQGIEHQWYSGSKAAQTAFGGTVAGFDGDSNVGPNFDVVAHFAHTFCTGLWTKEDMQMAGDWGHADALGTDYPLGAGEVGGQRHDHTDTADKRFADDLNNSGVQVNDKYTCVDAGTCANADGMQMGLDTTVLRWPNAGAFAGFYSFVTCANVDGALYSENNVFKYVFHTELGALGECSIGGASGTALAGTSADPQADCFVPRAVVVSLAVDDFRAEDCNGSDRQLKSRFNIRQAGTSIRNCGPGALPDADGGRCSWNWNFNTMTAAVTVEDDAESFFERSTPRDFQPWNTAHVANRRVQEGSPDSPIQDVTIATTLKDADGNALAGTITLDIPTEYVTLIQSLDSDVGDDPAHLAGTHEFTLTCNAGVAHDGSRDLFPDCYQGEEIHFEWVGNPEALSGTRLDPWATAVSATFA